MAAVLVEILSTGEQPVDRTLRLVAASKDADGLASDSVGLTAAVRDPVAGKWWNGDGLVWQDARHEHDMAEDVPGLYSLALATTSMVPSGELDVVVVVSSTDSPDAVALLPLRHGLRSRGRHHVDAALGFLELDVAIHEGEEGPITPGADVLAGVELGSALADDDAARGDELAAECFHAEALGI